MSDKRQFKHLGARLRAERPAPRSGLISAIVGRMPARVQRHPKASFRIALAAGMAVALVSAVTAVGGVGYAKSQVTHAVVAVKSTVQSTVTLHPSNSAPSVAKSASKTYKFPPIIKSVRTDKADPGCPGTVLIIKGENLQYVTTVLVGGDDQNPFLQHTPHLIIVKLEAGASGKITLVGTQGSTTYKKEFISKKCVPKDKDK
jgi:hypothetical protein